MYDAGHPAGALWKEEVGRKEKDGVQREGTHVCLWPIHVDIWQKLSQYCEAIASSN